MKTIIKVNIERFEENGQEYFIATSEDIQGLVFELPLPYWIICCGFYNSFFQLDFPVSMLQENSVKLIVYDIESEQISLWKE